MSATMRSASLDRKAFAENIRQAFSSQFPANEFKDLRILFSVDPDDQSVQIESDWQSVGEARKNVENVAAILSTFTTKGVAPEIRVQTYKTC